MPRLSSIAYKAIYSPYISFIPITVSTITTSTNAVNEGTALIFTVTTRNASDNTSLYWTINNTTTDISDFSGLSGYFTVTGNSGSFSITPLEDILTEGVETFTVSVRSDSITGIELIKSQTITINDTSIATYSLTRSVASVNEGSSFTITFATNQSASFPYTITGVTAADISGASLIGTATNGQVLTFNVAADVLTEGTETFTISLNNGLASTSVTINDTSVPAVAPVVWATAGGQASTSTSVTTAPLTSIQPNDIILLFLAYECTSAQTLGSPTSLVFGSFTWTTRVGVTGQGYQMPNKLTAGLYWARNTTGSTLTNRAFTANISSTFDNATIIAIQVRGASSTTSPFSGASATATTTTNGQTPVITLNTSAPALSLGFWTSPFSVIYAAPSGWELKQSVLNTGATYYSYSFCFSKTQTSQQTNVSTSSATTMTGVNVGAIAIVDSLVG